VKVSRAQRHIHQRSFHCSTNPVDAAEYLQEGMSQADHVLLDFDHKENRDWREVGQSTQTPRS
jgi:hypothetical protein